MVPKLILILAKSKNLELKKSVDIWKNIENTAKNTIIVGKVLLVIKNYSKVYKLLLYEKIISYLVYFKQ